MQLYLVIKEDRDVQIKIFIQRDLPVQEMKITFMNANTVILILDKVF